MVKSAKKVLGRARLRAAKIAKTRHTGVHSIGTDPKYQPNEFPNLAKRWQNQLKRFGDECGHRTVGPDAEYGDISI